MLFRSGDVVQLRGVGHVLDAHGKAQGRERGLGDVLGLLVGVIHVQALPVATATVFARDDLQLQLQV